MNNELEKIFFDTFGIGAYYKYLLIDKASRCYNEKLFDKTDFIDFIKSGKDYLLLKVIKYHPQITDHILLKLICYLSRYDLDLVPEYACFKTIDQLKEHVLKCALKFKIANSIPILYSQDLQELFKEV